tara:strand:+ start:786 stop:953 length:168 start_codon:yes stop_codon:yes gene_type:complete
MKVKIIRACKLAGNNWKKGDEPSVHPFFANELLERGYIAGEIDFEQEELENDGDI